MIQVRKRSRYIHEKKKRYRLMSVGISMTGNNTILQIIERHYSKESVILCIRILLILLCKRRYQINWKWKINRYRKSMLIL
jgi:hypothetical protein